MNKYNKKLAYDIKIKQDIEKGGDNSDLILLLKLATKNDKDD